MPIKSKTATEGGGAGGGGGIKKENSTELQKPNREAEIYNNSKKCD